MQQVAIGGIEVFVRDAEAADSVRSFVEEATSATAQQPALLTRIDQLSAYERHLERAATELVEGAARLLRLVHSDEVMVAHLSRAIPRPKAPKRLWSEARALLLIAPFAVSRTR